MFNDIFHTEFHVVLFVVISRMCIGIFLDEKLEYETLYHLLFNRLKQNPAISLTMKMCVTCNFDQF